MADFGLEDGYDHGEKSDADAGYQSSKIEHGNRDASRLDDTADYEDTTGHEDRSTSAQSIGESGTEGSQETASCEEGDDGAGTGICIVLQKERLERVGGNDFGNDAKIVAEQKGAQCSKAANEKLINTRLHRDRTRRRRLLLE